MTRFFNGFFFLAALLVLTGPLTMGQSTQRLRFDLQTRTAFERLSPAGGAWEAEGLRQDEAFSGQGMLLAPQGIDLSARAHHVSLALRWQATPVALGLRFAYRWADAAGKWQPWRDLPGDPHADLPVRESASTLQMMDPGATKVQLKVSFEDPAARLTHLQLDFFSPSARLRGATPTRTQGDSACAQPAYVSRTDWGCPEGQWSPAWWPAHNPTSHLVVHHTATGAAPPYAATVASIWQYHTNTLGWGDIGYNWLIAPDGTIYEGRAGGNHAQGAHMCARNGYTMGVGMIGTYIDSLPSAAALQALRDLLAWRASLLGLDPQDSAFHSPAAALLPRVLGHRDGCPPGYTECPGEAFHAWLPQLRDLLAQDADTCPNPVPSDGDVFITDRLLSQSSVRQGDSLTVSYTQYFSHRVDSPQISELAILLSQDCLLDATDLLLGADTQALSLSNPAASGSQRVQIPSTVVPGAYRVIFVADYPDQLAESDEQNNLRCRTLSVLDANATSLAEAAPSTWLRMFPNPTTDRLTLAFDRGSEVAGAWQLLDQMGRLLAQGSIAPGQGRVTIALPALPAGVYLLQVKRGAQRSAQRLRIVGD